MFGRILGRVGGRVVDFQGLAAVGFTFPTCFYMIDCHNELGFWICVDARDI